MQYVLINDNFVINGPRNWNARSFESTLEDDLELEFKLPLQKTDEEPIVIDENTKILPARLEYPGYNPKIEYIHGPFWDFSNDFAVGTFQVLPQNIEFVKHDLCQKTAGVRYNKEISGTKITIQDTEVTIDTARGVREIFVQKFLLMSDTDTVQWKFPEGWLTITKAELGSIVDAGVKHVQDMFDWEVTKCAEINSCATLEELDAVIIEDKPVNPFEPQLIQ